MKRAIRWNSVLTGAQYPKPPDSGGEKSPDSRLRWRQATSCSSGGAVPHFSVRAVPARSLMSDRVLLDHTAIIRIGACAWGGPSHGSTIVKREPFPGSDWTRISPPWAST